MTESVHEADGFSLRARLRFVQFCGAVLMVIGVVMLVYGPWDRGAFVLAIGIVVLLTPSLLMKLVTGHFRPDS